MSEILTKWDYFINKKRAITLHYSNSKTCELEFQIFLKSFGRIIKFLKKKNYYPS